MASGREMRYNKAMLTMNLTLTEGLPEAISFVVTDLDQYPVSVDGINFDAYLRARGSDQTLALKTEHGDNRGEIMVHVPALEPGPYDWELWRSADAGRAVFLKGSATCFPVLTVEKIAESLPGQRSFAISTQESGEAWQVRALPANVTLACLEKIREAYSENLRVERIEVDSLPPVADAKSNAVYYVKGSPWVVVGGRWLAQDVHYAYARPEQPGLLVVNETVEENAAQGAAEVKAAAAGNRYLVTAASLEGEAGVVVLSDDFVGHSPSAGLRIRRALPAGEKPGIVRVVGTEAEVENLPDVSEVYSVERADARTKELVKEEFDGKADSNLENLPAEFDFIISHGYNEETGYWWRKWRSGWLEQGGLIILASTTYVTGKVVLPVAYASENYVIFLTSSVNGLSYSPGYFDKTSTEFSYFAGSIYKQCSWYTAGFAG